jgi:alcohol dehydrogenase class IV
MVTRFEFATAQRIVFGEGAVRELGPLAGESGRRALVVSGRDPARSAPVVERLRASGLEVQLLSLGGEPTVAEAMAGAELARSMAAEVVVGVGGGSALDGAKAVSALAANPGDPLRHLEVIGEGRPLEHPPLPCLAVPTTAGTGSEVTRNAVLTSPEHQVKVSLRHAWMLPRVALVDPGLTWGLPPGITASTGLDALTQLIEPFLSTRANPLADAFCREGIPRVVRSLHRACRRGDDAEARTDLALASLLGGLALANAGLGAVHGLAAPLGGLRPVPHGAACAALLPHVLEANVQAMTTAGRDLSKVRELAVLLTGMASAREADGVRWLAGFVKDLPLQGLGHYGVKPGDARLVAERALASSSMKANPVTLDLEVLEQTLLRAL